MKQRRTIVGLDLSLTGTGVAVCTMPEHGDTPVWDLHRISHPKLNGHARVRAIRDDIEALIDIWHPTHAFLEGYSYASKFSHAHALGELGGVVKDMLAYTACLPYVPVPPNTVKKYATGAGNAKKEQMIAEAIRRLGYEGSSNDIADAMWLAAVGHAVLGRPIVHLPATHVAALEGIAL